MRLKGKNSRTGRIVLLLLLSSLFQGSVANATSFSAYRDCVFSTIRKIFNTREHFARVRLGKGAQFNPEKYEEFKAKYNALEAAEKVFPPEAERGPENALAYLEVISKDPATGSSPDFEGRWTGLSHSSKLSLMKPLNTLVSGVKGLKPSQVEKIVTQLFFSENKLMSIKRIWGDQKAWIEDAVQRKLAIDLQTKSVVNVLLENHLIDTEDANGTLGFIKDYLVGFSKDMDETLYRGLPERSRLHRIPIDFSDPDLIAKLNAAAKFDLRYERARGVVQSVFLAATALYVYHQRHLQHQKEDQENQKKMDKAFRPLEDESRHIQDANDEMEKILQKIEANKKSDTSP